MVFQTRKVGDAEKRPDFLLCVVSLDGSPGGLLQHFCGAATFGSRAFAAYKAILRRGAESGSSLRDGSASRCSALSATV
ncbi:MAG TPA: hypothetical protein VG324_04565 [Blastocatellia bacterium]|nr:hypothetical protein [Blastocatellia bacterium]